MTEEKTFAAIPGRGGNGPLGANSAYKGGIRTRALNTQEWVQDKIEEGDLDGGLSASQTGTSIFDPVLCELAYRWFCPPGGLVLDPFAGGSVRGIIASKLGRPYFGIDLSKRQIEANRKQAARICSQPQPHWHVGDARNLDDDFTLFADFIFSCPPYADLEVYSDDPRDLSTLDYGEFREAYADIIGKAVAKLKPDRFACFVVGEVRGPQHAAYYGLVPDTIRAFEAAGAAYYNECILVTAAGSLPIRAARQFEASRKIGKTHQNVLVFAKGDPAKATTAIGVVEFGDMADGDGAATAPLGGEV